MHLTPITLTGHLLRLEPLTLAHADDLMAQLIPHPDILAYHSTLPASYTPEAGPGYIEKLLAIPAMLPFAQILLDTGRAIGVTTFMDIRPAHHGLEIGSTWLGQPYHGQGINPESKYLLLRHAFEEQGAMRVQLKTDLRNLQSQRAIEKLGAHKEGILRQHILMPDGYRRDTVMYSILDSEWPAVKAGLEARLGYIP
jgi:RimJ/RimL family protein N-acetyltransferase